MAGEEGTLNGANSGSEDLDEFNLDYTGEPSNDPADQNLNAPELLSTDGEIQNETFQTDPQSVEDPKPEDETLGDGEEDDIESLRRQLAEANLRILQFEQGRNSTQPQPQQVAQQQAAQPQAGFPQMPNDVSNLDFIGQDDHIKLLESRDSFNALLNKVASVAYNAAVTASQERILRQIPAVVETTANQQLQIKDIVGRFYATNKDLEPYKPAVSMAAIKLHNDNPSMPLEEMLNKAAEETRKVLRIRPTSQTRPRVPAQPVGGGRVGGDRTARPANLTEQEQQILDLLS